VLLPGCDAGAAANILRRYEQQRRADLKTEGAQRIDVTLRGAALDNYATVRSYIEDLNRFAAERRRVWLPIRLSDTEVIKMALGYAASAMRDEDDKAAKESLVTMLGAAE
jgi:hypothetical protein